MERTHIAKVRTADGRELTSHSEILAEVEEYYGLLYSRRAERSVTQNAEDPRAPLMRHYTKDVPEVDVDEISTALGQFKSGKAPGDNGITTHLLKATGIPVLKAFNSDTLPGAVPKAWSKNVVVLIFKKGDKAL